MERAYDQAVSAKPSAYAKSKKGQEAAASSISGGPGSGSSPTQPGDGQATIAGSDRPTGDDRTFWVTDAAESPAAVEEALGRDGVAAELVAQAGGLKLFALAGYYMPRDERLARAPGRLTGVIGAAPGPLDAAE